MMKVFWINLRVLLMAALMGASSLFAGETVPMTQLTTLRILRGDTTWTPQLDGTFNLNPLQLRYTPAGSCPTSPQAAIQVHFLDDPNWYGTTFEKKGMFRHKGGTIDAVRVNFRSYQYPQMICDMQLFGVTQDQPPPASEPRYVGVISYAGGYLNRGAVNWQQAIGAQQFQIKVPDFCGAVEIVEAGTWQSGERFIAAKVVPSAPGGRDTPTRGNSSIYTFDTVLPLTNLVLSLNGPKNSSCDIPLYVFPKS